MKLLIANKGYSSWSQRAWILLRHFGIPFEEIVQPMYVEGWKEEILKISPSGKVPALRDGSLVVWESLALCEYAAEQNPAMWPADPRARAIARAIAAEMHAGFTALRSALPMNLRATGRKVALSPAVLADIDRIEHIWADCRARYGVDGGGPWLFGQWSMADAMYAPLATRFITYGIHRSGAFDDYIATVVADPLFQEWRAEALTETALMADNEAGE